MATSSELKNPLQYTSRDFLSIISDINSDDDLVDKPNWFKRIWAGVGDVIAMYQNAIANNNYLSTAFTRDAVKKLCELIDYELSPQATSSGDLIFYLNADTVIFPLSLTVDEIKASSEGSLAVSSKKFEARTSQTVTNETEGFTTDYITNNYLTVSRVYTTGEKVRVTSDNTLPDPLTTDTDYYVIYISDTEIELATTLVNAYNGTYITLVDDGVGNHTITVYSFISTCYQQESLDAEIIVGISDGVSEWQQFDLPDLLVLEDTITVTIGVDTWTKVDTFIDSISTDKHYRLLYKTDGKSYIEFGNGDYGSIPSAVSIYVSYSYGGGVNSNITGINKINIYAGGNSDVIGVSNPAAMTGGADEESLTSAKKLAPILLKTRDRFITSEDGRALALGYSGIEQAQVNKNIYGLLSAQVLIVPSGGGNPSSALKTALQSYLIDRTVLESIDVRVEDPTYSAQSVTATVKILSGYTFSDVKNFVVLGLRLLFTEVGNELLTLYEESGISSAVDFINTKWSTSFEEVDYEQIKKLLDPLLIEDSEGRNGASYFGKTFQSSDVLGYIDTYVNGVDYLIIASPTFPITTLDSEITQDNINPTNITQIV